MNCRGVEEPVMSYNVTSTEESLYVPYRMKLYGTINEKLSEIYGIQAVGQSDSSYESGEIHWREAERGQFSHGFCCAK